MDKTEVHWVPLAGDWGWKVDKKESTETPDMDLTFLLFFSYKANLENLAKNNVWVEEKSCCRLHGISFHLHTPLKLTNKQVLHPLPSI